MGDVGRNVEQERRRLSGRDATVATMSRDGMPEPEERLAELNRLLDQLDGELDGARAARGSVADRRNQKATLLAGKASALLARELLAGRQLPGPDPRIAEVDMRPIWEKEL